MLKLAVQTGQNAGPDSSGIETLWQKGGISWWLLEFASHFSYIRFPR
jgi:hypothetical protein